MRAYYSVFRIRLINGMQYRTAAWAGIATQFFFGLIFIMAFEAFYSHSAHQAPMSLKEVISFVWLQQAFLALITLWFRDNELFTLITSGNLAYELCRPWSIYGFWFAKLLAQRLSSALLRCFPVLLVAFLVPEPHRMMAPPSLENLLLFIVALVLGLLILVSLSMFLYLSVFYTMSPAGSLVIFTMIGEFFSGLIIPVPLMPLWLQKIAGVLPFRMTADFPLRVYSGNIPANEAMEGILIQLGWLAVLLGIGIFLFQKVMRKVVIQGG